MKYIVYQTLNTVNNKIYIGVHKTETPYVFDQYLGNGVKTNDRASYRNCRTPFESAVNKYGPDKFIRKTLKVFDTLQDALDLEIWLVDKEFITRRDTYNVTLGGGMPPITCKIIYQYSLDGEFIKEWPSIVEASIFYKCSASSIGKAIFERTPSIRFLWSETKYKKIDTSNFKIDENKTKVYLYDLDGNYLQEFISIVECATFVGITKGTLSSSIKGKYQVAKQFYVSDIKYDKFIVQKQISHKGCPIYQYDLSGKYMRGFDTIKEVEKLFGKTFNPNRAIRTGATCLGFQWSWEKVDSMKVIKQKTESRKVGKYTLDGELVEVFDTVRKAKLDTCAVPAVLSGERKSAGGYIFKYIVD